MDKRAVARSAAVAVVSQGVTTAVSALTVLLLAGRLDEVQYGLWQFFLLIGGYSGLFHLGLCDGVYLACGGSDYTSLDLPRLGTLLRGMTAIQLAAAAALSALSALTLGGGRMWAVILALIYMPLFNAGAYLGNLAQATGHCTRYSVSVMLDRVCFAAGTATAALGGVTDFRVYAGICIFSRLVSAAFLAFTERRVVTAPHCRVDGLGRELRPGARLLVANLAGQLWASAPRWAILWRMGEAELGRVSLLITLSGMLTQVASQLAMVLFPALRREDGAARARLLCKLGGTIRLALPAVLLFLRPLGWLIGLILPRYAPDSYLLAALLPAGILDAHTQLVSLTEMKVARREGRMMVLELACGGLGLALCLGAAALGGDRLTVLLFAAFCAAVRCVAATACTESAGRTAETVRAAAFALVCIVSIPLNLYVGTWCFAALYALYLSLTLILRRARRALGAEV